MTDSDFLQLVRLLVKYGIRGVLLSLAQAVQNRPRDRYTMRRILAFHGRITAPGAVPVPEPKLDFKG